MSTPNLGLSTMPENSLQPAIPFNETLQIIDAILQGNVLDKDLTAPPTTVLADAGKRWIVGPAATGAWATKSGQIALCVGADLWYFIPPKTGFCVYVTDEARIYQYNGSAWAPVVENGPAGAITGLVMVYNSTTSIDITAGSAHIQSLGYAVSRSSTINKTIAGIAANTWYHVYAYNNAGVLDFEFSTTAPAAAYSGTARSKTGDTSRRYIGSVRSNASSQIFKFLMEDTRIIYLENCTATPFRVLSNGTVHTGWTQVDFSAVVPITSRMAYGNAQNLAPSGGVGIGTDNAGTGFYYVINPAQAFAAFWPLDSSLSAYYDYITGSAPTTGLYWDVWGYIFTR